MAGSGQALASAHPSLAGISAVRGQLAGAPSLGGIRVALYAEPGPLFMKQLHQGQHFQMKLVGSATSSAAGAYTITVSHPGAITASENQQHITQLWIMAAGHGYVSLRGLPVKVAAGGTKLGPMFGKASLAPATAGLQMHHIASSHPAAAVDAAAVSGCWVLSQDLGQTWATVGPMYSTIEPVVKKLSYTDGSTSGTSIAISTGGSGDN